MILISVYDICGLKKCSIHIKDGLAVKSISVRIYDTYNCFVFLSTCVEMAWWMEAWKDGWMVPRWIMVFCIPTMPTQN